MANAQAIWDNANEDRNRLRNIANSEIDFRNEVYQEDLSYRNQLISIFGKPYEGTIGPGKLYPAGYDGPDTLLYMYVDVRQIDNSTVPGPTTTFASFTTNGALNGGDVYEAFVNGQGKGAAARGTLADIQHNFMPLYLGNDVLRLFSPTLAADTNNNKPILARDGWYAVNYTDLNNPKVPLENMELPVTAAGYTFQAPSSWGARQAAGELQQKINQMLQQEAQVASAIGAWDALQGGIVRALRLANAKLDMMANIRLKNELFSRLKLIVSDIIKGIEGVMSVLEEADKTVTKTTYAIQAAIPRNLPTGGVAVSPGDALAPVRGGISFTSVGVTAGIGAGLAAAKITELFIEMGLELTENELELFEKREENAMAAKEMFVEIENLLGDEPIKRIEIFKEIQALREMSDEYRALLDQGARLIDERAAFNKRVAAQTQRNRYQDMTFRVSRNHALQTYRSAFDLAARYAYLAAKAYDYELNLDPADPGSPSAIFSDIMRARSVGKFENGDPGDAYFGSGGLAEALAWLKANYEVQKNQLGFMNPPNGTWQNIIAHGALSDFAGERGRNVGYSA